MFLTHKNACFIFMTSKFISKITEIFIDTKDIQHEIMFKIH